MTNKVGIIGMGHVGSTLAHQLIVSGVAEKYVFIDKNNAKVNSDALDFRDALPNLNTHFEVTVNNYAALKDADVVISALGNVQIEKETHNNRRAEFTFTRKQVPSVGKKLKASGFHGVLVDITNPCDAITNLYQKATGFPKNKVMGTGTLLDSSRLKRTVGDVFSVDPRSVSGYNLGEHGDSQFTAWSTVKVLDQPISKWCQENNLDLKAISQKIKLGGHKVFFGKFYTNYGIAAAASHLVQCILNDSHQVLPVCNFRKDYGTCLSYPAVVGRKGVIKPLNLTLTKMEKEKLANSAKCIKQASSYTVKSEATAYVKAVKD